VTVIGKKKKCSCIQFTYKAKWRWKGVGIVQMSQLKLPKNIVVVSDSVNWILLDIVRRKRISFLKWSGNHTIKM